MNTSAAIRFAGILMLLLLACSERTDTLPGGASMAFVYIEPGNFTMGSPASEEGRFDNEGPQHEVTISQGFYFAKHEVTQGQWESVIGTRPWSEKDYVQENPNHPVVYVSWHDAQAFIQKLNAAVEDSLYRLPTEAEWEYACRAGTKTAWSFGADSRQLTDYAWYKANTFDISEAYAHEVGKKKPNPFGLYDMHGNVWEWVQDWAGRYSSRSQVHPTGPTSGSYRVIRGGYFYYAATDARCANRSSPTPFAASNAMGFRLVRRIE